MTSLSSFSAVHVEAVSVEESEGYTFPNVEDLENFTLRNVEDLENFALRSGSSAKIQLPQSLLEARVSGRSHSWSEDVLLVTCMW